MIKKGETYIIGEIGQNHNGSVDIAKLIVELIARPVREETFGLDLKPMNAVKMTRRDLNEELTTTQMNRIYDTPNSFGRTYGEHRAFLELDDQAHYEVYKFAKEKGLDFVETLCAKGCLSMLKLFTPDYLKVASRDLTNLPLLSAMLRPRYLLSSLRVWLVKRSLMMLWRQLHVITAIFLYCIVYLNIQLIRII